MPNRTAPLSNININFREPMEGDGHSSDEHEPHSGESLSPRHTASSPRTNMSRCRALSMGSRKDDMYDTLESMPTDIMYRNDVSVRPSLRSLMSGEGIDHDAVKSIRKEESNRDTQEKKRTKFGVCNGVFTPCLLNIWGIMMFLRLGWIVGTAGFICTTLIILICFVVSIVTTSSMSAICTNGEVKGGGAYFMISRALGPEFGGPMGIILYIANAGAVGMYMVGFSETVVELFPEGSHMASDGSWDITLVSLILFVVVGCLLKIGVSSVMRFQVVLLFILTVAIVSFVIGASTNDPMPSHGFTGYKSATLDMAWEAEWGDESFFSILGIFFPAATGLMAGANMSGDLKRPDTDIPRGTAAAVVFSNLIYWVLAFLLAASCVKTVGGSEEGGLIYDRHIMMEVSAWSPAVVAGIIAASLSSAIASFVGAPRILQAVVRDKVFPTLQKMRLGEGVGPDDEPLRGYLVTGVIIIATLFVGDLNVIAPYISNFFLLSYGFINYACFYADHVESPGWRPSFKYYNKWISLSGVLMCVFLMFTISPVTAFLTLLVTFALFKYIDLNPPSVSWGSAVHARVWKDAIDMTNRLEGFPAHVKNYRPSFLVLSNPTESVKAQVSLVRFMQEFSKPSHGLLTWGNVVLGSFDDPTKQMEVLQLRDSNTLLNNSIAGFTDAVVSDSVRSGYQVLMQTSGVGRLRVNTVVIRFPVDWTTLSEAEINQFVGTVRDAFYLGHSVVMVRGVNADFIQNICGGPSQSPLPSPSPSSLSPLHTVEDGEEREERDNDDAIVIHQGIQSDDNVPPPTTTTTTTTTPERTRSLAWLRRLTVVEKEYTGTLDVYWLTDDGGLTVLLPHILTKTRKWSKCVVRVLTPGRAAALKQSQQMVMLLQRFRIKANVVVLDDLFGAAKTYDPWNQLECGEVDRPAEKSLRLGEILSKFSQESTMVIMSLPVPRKNLPSRTYMGWLDVSSRVDCPVVLIRGSQQVLTYYS